MKYTYLLIMTLVSASCGEAQPKPKAGGYEPVMNFSDDEKEWISDCVLSLLMAGRNTEAVDDCMKHALELRYL